jgi:hypothetical protein
MANDMRRLKRALQGEYDSLVAKGYVVESDDMRLYRYGESTDIELYRRLQTEANKMKIENQWVPEDHIKCLAEYMLAQGLSPKRGICHGTRRGNEQMWFMDHLGNGVEVIGTEISDTATQFPHTIQWDFHEVDPDWVGALDFVYSNSWDHSYDPELAFARWSSCLRPGGFMLLDHGWNYQPDRVSAMDPFGITEDGLVRMLDRVCVGVGKVAEVINGARHRSKQIRTIVFRAAESG